MNANYEEHQASSKDEAAYYSFDKLSGSVGDWLINVAHDGVDCTTNAQLRQQLSA